MSEFSLTVRRKPIKNMYIRVKPGQQVVVTVPLKASSSSIMNFVLSHNKWIYKSLMEVPDLDVHNYVNGEIHRILGEDRPLYISEGPVNACKFTDHEILMTLQDNNADREKLFIRSAKDFLAGYLDFYISSWAPVMNVSPASFSIRKTRNKWGSCHIRSKMLNFSLDLISKPLFCIEMVVVHELNHLIEPTHNERFHALMHHWLPDYKERQNILSSAKREFY